MDSKIDFKLMKNEIDYEFSLLEEFYSELREKLIEVVSDYDLEESLRFFLIKMFRLDKSEYKHFDLVSFIEKTKNYLDVIVYII